MALERSKKDKAPHKEETKSEADEEGN